LNIKADDSKASVCFQDGREAVSILMSFSFSLNQRNKKVSSWIILHIHSTSLLGEDQQ